MIPPASNDYRLMTEHAYYERSTDDQQMNIQAPWTVTVVAVAAAFTLYKVTAFVMRSWRKDRTGPILPEHAV